MLLKCFAKINWSLDILSKRDDGYHNLSMLMQSVNIYDTLHIVPSEHNSLIINGKKEVDVNSNLCFKAVKAYNDFLNQKQHYAIKLTKCIPIGAGLGGGSSDAAGVLLALNIFNHHKLSMDELQTVGKSIGADVPFMLTGGTAKVQGIGEEIEKIENFPQYNVLVVFDDLFLSTKEVFTRFSFENKHSIPINDIIKTLICGDIEKISHQECNALYSSATMLKPQIAQIRNELYRYGAIFASMTGSGSAVFAVFSSDKALNSAYEQIKHLRKQCFKTHTLNYGLEILER